MPRKILFHGAEALVFLDANTIIKKRVRKSYRLKELDETIRKLRTRSETKLLKKASKLIPAPEIVNVDEKEKEISMKFIKGKKLSDKFETFSDFQQLKIFKKIGENISKLHDSSIIHGDLTTSNMIFNEEENKVYFIDFGLGFFSDKVEDKAVDLHLLKQVLKANHFRNWDKNFNEIIKSYKISKDFEKVLERLKKVESRGRYKDKH